MSENSPLKTYGWQIARAFISFGVVIIYSRFLGAEGRGEMSVLLLYLQVVLMFVELFAGSAMSNWLVKYRPSQIIPWIYLYIFFIIALSAVVLNFVFHIDSKIIAILLSQGFALSMLNVEYNILQSMGWIGKRNKLQMALEGLKLISLLIFVFFIPRQLNYHTNIANILMILSLVSFLILSISAKNITYEIHKKGFPPEAPPIGIFFEGIWAQLGHFVLFLVSKSPLWLVARYLGDSQAGVFANALLIADTIWIFPGSFGTIIHARVIRNSNATYHQRLLKRYFEISLIGSLILGILMMLTPNFVFTGIFGENFALLKYDAILILPGILFISMSSTIGNYLHATNRFKEILRNHTVSFCTLLGVIWVGFQYKLSIEMVALGMNLAFLTLLILHLYTINWQFNKGLNLRFNILLFKRLVAIRWRKSKG